MSIHVLRLPLSVEQNPCVELNFSYTVLSYNMSPQVVPNLFFSNFPHFCYICAASLVKTRIYRFCIAWIYSNDPNFIIICYFTNYWFLDGRNRRRKCLLFFLSEKTFYFKEVHLGAGKWHTLTKRKLSKKKIVRYLAHKNVRFTRTRESSGDIESARHQTFWPHFYFYIKTKILKFFMYTVNWMKGMALYQQQSIRSITLAWAMLLNILINPMVIGKR